MNRTCSTIAALYLATLAGSALAQPDAFGYTATDAVAYAYADIAPTGASILAGSDDASATLALPFSFKFYGVNYNSVCVSTNGLLSFGSCVQNDFANVDLTAQAPPGDQPLIAPLWMDLTFAAHGTGSVVYQTEGTPGSRRFIVQWNQAAILNITGTLNFQVILVETSNQILMQYRNVTSPSQAVSNAASATVGIRGAGGHLNGNRLQWSFHAPVVTSASALAFNAPAAAAPVDITTQFKVTTSALPLNRQTQTYSGTVTLTNTSSAPVNRPLVVVLTALVPTATAVEPTGNATGLGPYYNVPGSLAIAPGQSVQVPVKFSNPSNALIKFVPKVYAGSF